MISPLDSISTQRTWQPQMVLAPHTPCNQKHPPTDHSHHHVEVSPPCLAIPIQTQSAHHTHTTTKTQKLNMSPLATRAQIDLLRHHSIPLSSGKRNAQKGWQSSGLKVYRAWNMASAWRRLVEEQVNHLQNGHNENAQTSCNGRDGQERWSEIFGNKLELSWLIMRSWLRKWWTLGPHHHHHPWNSTCSKTSISQTQKKKLKRK